MGSGRQGRLRDCGGGSLAPRDAPYERGGGRAGQLDGAGMRERLIKVPQLRRRRTEMPQFVDSKVNFKIAIEEICKQVNESNWKARLGSRSCQNLDTVTVT